MIDTLNKEFRTLKLSIVEVDYHAEVVQSLCMLLAEAPFEISLIVNQKVHDKLSFPQDVRSRISFYVQGKKQSCRQFLNEVRIILDRSDLVYFNTIERKVRLFNNLELKSPYFVCSHNIHSDLAPGTSIDSSSFGCAKIYWYLLTKVVFGGQWRSKKKFLHGAKGIMCANKSIADYAREKNFRFSEKVSILALPYVWMRNGVDKQKVYHSEPISIVIPGSVNPRRKNYNVLLKAFKLALPSLERRLRLVFLGRVVGNDGLSFIRQFRALESEVFEVRSFESTVSAGFFEQEIRAASFLISSVEIKTHRKIYSEIYGKSKISGIDSDIVSSQRPALVNNDYRLSDDLLKVCDTYDGSDELAQKISHWVNDEKYKEFEDGFSSLEDYSADAQRQAFYQYCLSLIE